MNRRRALAGAAAALAWPAFARAQSGRRRVGLLMFGSPEPFARRFRAALDASGWRDVEILLRSAGGRVERTAALAEDLVTRRVDVIVANATPSIEAATAATRTIPIVMAAAGDALRTGLVDSLARPGGNLTGLSLALVDLAGKTVALLHDALPSAKRVACVVHSDDPLHRGFADEAARSARDLGLDLAPVVLDDASAMPDAFASMARRGVQGVIVQPILILDDAKRDAIVQLQFAHRIPAISGLRRFADRGGFMAYAAEFPDVAERAAGYVDRLLRGARPAELPVELPSRYTLVVNVGTARRLGIDVPAGLLARAEAIVE